MSEIIVKELCPHCKKETIVWRETEEGFLRFRGCQHCDGTLEDLPWRERTWYVARELKPK